MKRLQVKINKSLLDELKAELGRKNVPRMLWEEILLDWAMSVVTDQEKPEFTTANIVISDDAYDVFKISVQHKYGNSKGAVSRAVQEALWKWLHEKDHTYRKAKIEIIKGYLGDDSQDE